MIELLDSEKMKKLIQVTKLSKNDLDIFLALRHTELDPESSFINDKINSSSFLSALAEEIKNEDRDRGIVSRGFYNKEKYLQIIKELYERAGSKHYQSRYIKYRTNCPYYAYCTLSGKINTKPDWMFKGFKELVFPDIFEVLKHDIRCSECVLSCDQCGKSEFVCNKMFLIVHHVSYKVPPESREDWTKFYKILCGVCNHKPENIVAEEPDELNGTEIGRRKLSDFFNGESDYKESEIEW